MNKKLLKLGALTLGLFASVFMLNNYSNAADALGNVNLTINAGETKCTYLTSLTLTAQQVKIDEAYEFSGDFEGGVWNCTDLVGLTGGWYMSIDADDLHNANNNTIYATGVSVQYDSTLLTGSAQCKSTLTAATRYPIANPQKLLERTPAGDNEICTITTNKVTLKVDVEKNQAPGVYSGTLTITLNGINS